jgi:hypothetical protein
MGDRVLIRSSGQELASITFRSIKTRIGPKLWSESEVSLHLQAGLAKRFHQRHCQVKATYTYSSSVLRHQTFALPPTPLHQVKFVGTPKSPRRDRFNSFSETTASHYNLTRHEHPDCQREPRPGDTATIFPAPAHGFAPASVLDSAACHPRLCGSTRPCALQPAIIAHSRTTLSRPNTMASSAPNNVPTHNMTEQNNTMSFDASAITSAPSMAKNFFDMSRELRDMICEHPCLLEDKVICEPREQRDEDTYHHDLARRIHMVATKPRVNMRLVSKRFAFE